MIKRGSPWTLAAALVMAFAMAPAVFAQESDALLKEAVDLYERGRDEEALAKLRDLMGQDPSSEEAARLRDSLEFRQWARIMIKGDAHHAVVKELLDRALPEATNKADDADAIKALVGKLGEGDWKERAEAMRQLLADHGEYAVPHMLSRLGSDSVERRAEAMEWLRRMGTQSVLPLVQVLKADDATLVSSAATVLGQIHDRRALPYLAWLANTAGDASVRDAAARALQGIGDGMWVGNVGGLYLDLAEKYYQRDTSVVDPFRRIYPVWSLEDGNLVSHEWPRDVYHLKLAEGVLFDYLAQDAGSFDAQVLLSSVLLAEAEAGAGSEGGSLNNAAFLAAAGGPTVLNDVVGKAIRDGRPEVARGAVKLLGSMLGGNTFGSQNGLTMGVTSPYKGLRIDSALAILQVMPNGAFAGQEAVIPALMEALGQDSVRSVVVIDDHEGTRNQMVADLNARGWYAYGVASGSQGLSRVREFPIEDLVVIRYDLADRTVSEVVKMLRADPRTQERPIALIVEPGDAATARANYDGRVQVFVETPLVADGYEPMLKAALGEMDAAREEATGLAAQAATMLRWMDPHGGPFASAQALPALVGTLRGHHDSVRVPAMQALGRIGDPSAVQELMVVMGDASASEEARGNAALALAHTFSAQGGTPADFSRALSEALAGEGGLGFKTMLGQAAGVAPMAASERTAVMNALRGSLSAMGGMGGGDMGGDAGGDEGDDM